MAIDGIFLSPALLADARGGILALGSVMPSDHRALWVDIKASVVAMEQRDSAIQQACRRLKCNDPRIVNWYNYSLLAAVIELHAEEHVETLFQVAQDGHWTEAQETEYNVLDHQLMEAKLDVEAKCRTIHAGQTPWTPALTQAIQRILYWKGVFQCI